MNKYTYDRQQLDNSYFYGFELGDDCLYLSKIECTIIEVIFSGIFGLYKIVTSSGETILAQGQDLKLIK